MENSIQRKLFGYIVKQFVGCITLSSDFFVVPCPRANSTKNLPVISAYPRTFLRSFFYDGWYSVNFLLPFPNISIYALAFPFSLSFYQAICRILNVLIVVMTNDTLRC